MNAQSIITKIKGTVRSLAYSTIIGIALIATAYVNKTRADAEIPVEVTFTKTASHAVYEAINNWVAQDPANRGKETNFVIMLVMGDTVCFEEQDSYWPPTDLTSYRNLDPNLVPSYSLNIISRDIYTFPGTNYIRNNTGRITFTGVDFNGGLVSDYCIKIESTAKGDYSFIGMFIRDLNDTGEPNLPPLGDCSFTRALVSSIYFDGSGGANLNVAGVPFREVGLKSITIRGLAKNKVNILRNIFTGVGTAIEVEGEAVSGNEQPVLNIVHNIIWHEGSNTVGINFKEPLTKTTGECSNNSFINLYIGIKNCRNSGNITIANNNFYNVTIDHEGIPVNDFHFPPEYSGYNPLPTSKLIDRGKYVGIPYKGCAPDIGVFESEYEGDWTKADLTIDCRIDFYDFAIMANHWLEFKPNTAIPGNLNTDFYVNYEDLRLFSDYWLDGYW